MEYLISEMKPCDWPQISKIYLQGINTGLATFQTELPTFEQWDNGHLKFCRLVARLNDRILGFAVISPVSGRCCYNGVAEVSVYIDEDLRGYGVGTALLNKLIELSENNGIWTLQSVINSKNHASIALHKKCGFREVGIREKIAKSQSGEWHDTVLMERRSNIIY